MTDPEAGVDERALVEAAQSDPARFGDLYELHFNRVYAFVARRVWDRAAAEDVTSEVFHKALAGIGRFEWRGTPFVAWLLRIASNAIVDRAKRVARERTLPPIDEVLAPPPEGDDRRARIDGAIRHAELRIGDSVVEVSDGSAAFPAIASAMHLYVEDADAAYARALEAGATSVHAPVDQPYGDREAGVKDPAGNSWYLATHRATGLAPEGLRSVTPYVQARDTAGLIDFVRRAFGGEERDRTESPDGIVHHAKLRIGDSVLEMGEAHGPYGLAPVAIHLHVADVDAVYARAIRGGAEPIFSPADQPYGERSGGVRDPFGNHWFIATYFEDVAS